MCVCVCVCVCETCADFLCRIYGDGFEALLWNFRAWASKVFHSRSVLLLLNCFVHGPSQRQNPGIYQLLMNYIIFGDGKVCGALCRFISYFFSFAAL